MSKMKGTCRLCGEKTNTNFEIRMSQTTICEDCANAVFLQQALWYVRHNKHIFNALNYERRK